MQPDLRGIKVGVLGGDARELVLVSTLVTLGAQVKVVGLPVTEELPHIRVCPTLEEAVAGVQGVILPVPGIDNEQGNIYSVFSEKPLTLSESLLVRIPPQTPVFVGIARPRLKEMAKRCNVRLIEVLKLDEVAILNAIPSAEGAVQMAMEATSITIHDSQSFVLGWGRTGISIACLLQGMGARVSVVARNPAHLARAYQMGMRPLSYEELPDAVGDAEILFNTVPALVLTNCILSKMKSDAVIIDVASPPGGVDYDAAHRLGIKSLLAPGLPGKVAPKTAGQILARVIPKLMAQELSLSKGIV